MSCAVVSFAPITEEIEPEPVQLVPKGKKGDAGEFKKKIDHLVKLADTEITKLAPSDLAVYHDCFTTIRMMYDDDEFFSEIYNYATKAFRRDELYAPSTVGAYFSGCLCGDDIKHGGACGVTCAGSMPPPRSAEFKFCGFNVIWLNRGNHGFELRHLHRTKSNRALLHFSGSRFPGLSKHEKQLLKNNGVHEVEVFVYSGVRKTRKYKSLTKTFVKIEDVAERVDRAPDPAPEYGGLILLIVVLLFLALLLWLLLRKPIAQ